MRSPCHLGAHGLGVQLDRGALGVEAEAGLPLLVGADAVVGDEGPACACDGTELPVWNTVPTLARSLRPVHPLQTSVCIVKKGLG